jgi:hypothetical protein
MEGGSVNRFVNAVVIVVGVLAAWPSSLNAQARTSQPATAAGSRIRVCSLLPKEEVKKHVPWLPVLDQMPIEEEPVGVSGSSCNYPSVFIQVLPFSQRTIDMARQQGGLEPLTGIGDEAYFHNNKNLYAEVFVKVGNQLLTLQANLQGEMAVVKPGVLNLAKALVAKLR